MEGGIIFQAEEGGDDRIFVYTGGEQEVPRNVSRVRIDKSVKIIPRNAFNGRVRLVHLDFHDGIEIIGGRAFSNCPLLSSVKLLGVKVIEVWAFSGCSGLTDVEFGDKLETIGPSAFPWCTSLRNVMMPSVRTIGEWAFCSCKQLTDLVLPEGVETVGRHAFQDCPSLRRIAMPLKDNVIEDDVFRVCPNLTMVTLIGGIHKIIHSLVTLGELAE